MIIYQGLGFLVVVIVFAFSLLANLIFNAEFGEGFYDHHKWPFALSLLFSAGACWLLGIYLSKRSDQVIIDTETGKKFIINRSKNTLFFIPVIWWGVILLIIAWTLFLIEYLH